MSRNKQQRGGWHHQIRRIEHEERILARQRAAPYTAGERCPITMGPRSWCACAVCVSDNARRRQQENDNAK